MQASCWRDAEQAERCCWDRCAAVHHSDDRSAHSAPAQTFSDNVCVAYGDHEVSVDRRRSHRADVRRRRTRSLGSRLCHRQGPVGPLAARASTDCRSAAECA